MEERLAMLREYDTGLVSVAELARRYGVSRETVYVWKARRAHGDPRWFEARSRAPHRRPHTMPDAIAAVLLATRRRFPDMGPKKLRAWLAVRQPAVAWPAPATIGDLLARTGLVAPRRRRRRAVLPGDTVVVPATAANDEWAIDFKGWFRTRDGTRCDPLTVTDTVSRYLLQVQIMRPTVGPVRAALEHLFREVGVPAAIRADNGPPFGAPAGLSALAVWWLKLGIEPRYIPPGAPQDNGRHERMHRTLKAHTTRPAAATLAAQQTRFDAFRHYFNTERPHEALGQTVPAAHWQPSPRGYSTPVHDPWYDADHQVRRVHGRGHIRWQGTHVYVGEALAGELVGVTELANGGHLVRFCTRDLGVIDAAARFHRFIPPWARLRPRWNPENIVSGMSPV